MLKMLKRDAEVLVFLCLLGASLVRALHVVDLLRSQLARPRDRLLKARAHVQAVAVRRPSTHRSDVDGLRPGSEQRRRAADAQRVGAEEQRVLVDGEADLPHDGADVVRRGFLANGASFAIVALRCLPLSLGPSAYGAYRDP